MTHRTLTEEVDLFGRTAYRVTCTCGDRMVTELEGAIARRTIALAHRTYGEPMERLIELLGIDYDHIYAVRRARAAASAARRRAGQSEGTRPRL